MIIHSNHVVTDTPLNFTVTRSISTLFSWSPPVSNDPAVTGYEIFYELSDGTRLSVDVGNTTQGTLSLALDQNYTAFVVAYGGDLPSNTSNIEFIPQGN